MKLEIMFLAAMVAGTAGLSVAVESSSLPNAGPSASGDVLIVAQNQPGETKVRRSESNPTVSPETTGQDQPQGPTGPINTTTGGAPAESPQGETPPGMQSAPEGSSKATVGPKQ